LFLNKLILILRHHHGGLGLLTPEETPNNEYENSTLITAKLRDAILAVKPIT